MPRGGDQVIPRPVEARPGSPPPWAGRPPAHISLADVHAALAGAASLPVAPRPAPEPGGEAPAAVLAPLYERDGRAHVVLTRRARHMRRHRGEVSFPGGRSEPGDAELLATALREAHEEVGLAPSDVAVIGELDPLRTLWSRSFIAPFVGTLQGPPALRPDPREVERILHVPLDELLVDDVFREERWGPPSLERPVWFFEVEGDTIWGATAAILRDLLVRVVLRTDQGTTQPT